MPRQENTDVAVYMTNFVVFVQLASKTFLGNTSQRLKFLIINFPKQK